MKYREIPKSPSMFPALVLPKVSKKNAVRTTWVRRTQSECRIGGIAEGIENRTHIRCGTQFRRKLDIVRCSHYRTAVGLPTGGHIIAAKSSELGAQLVDLTKKTKRK